MNVNKDFEDLLRHFNRAKVQFLIVGAYAVIFYPDLIKAKKEAGRPHDQWDLKTLSKINKPK